MPKEKGQDSTDLADPMVRISIASVTALMYHGYLNPKSVSDSEEGWNE